MRKSSLLILMCVAFFVANPSFSKSKVHALKLKKVKRDANLSRSKYPLTYDATWFAHLPKKQQLVYLDVMGKLAVNIATKKVSQNRFHYIDYLIEKANAARDWFNIGYVYQGDWKHWIANKDFGSLNQCSSGTYPCAIYTCMRKDSNGNTIMCCGTTSTSPCVEEGRRSENKEARRKFLANCQKSNSKNCQVANSEMRDATKNVEKWCLKNDAMGKGFCKDAVASLKDSGVPFPPSESGAPTGENCDQVSKELVKRKQDSRTGDETKAAYNNPFWQDMGSVARKVCKDSSNKIAEKMGVCDKKGSLTTGGYGGKAKTYNKETDKAGFDKCVAAKKANATENLNKKISQARTRLEDRSLSDGQKAELERSIESWQRLITKSEASIDAGAASKGLCSALEDREASGLDSLPIEALSDDIFEKIKAGKKLSSRDENHFKAATGLSSAQFKKSFCDSENHGALKRSNPTSYYTSKVIGDMKSKSVEKLADQARTAFKKMTSCFNALKPIAGKGSTGCAFYDVKNPYILRDVSNESPILAKDKESGKCVLVTKQSDNKVHLKYDDETGNEIFDSVSRITIDDLDYGKTITSSIGDFEKNNYLKEYRCDGDSKMKFNIYNDGDGDDGPGATVESDH